MKKFLLSIMLTLSTLLVSATCNFGSKNPYFSVWDSCSNHVLYGYIAFNAPTTQTSCFKYTWKVNNVVITHDRYMKDTLTANGTYNVCCTVVDTCNNCDTSFCSTRTINCNNNGTPTCNWGRIGFFYSYNCRSYTFEMGSMDTCLSYVTLLMTSGKVDTISKSRVFSYSFVNPGNYTLKTLFHNKCCNKDTFIYSQINVTCTLGLNSCRFGSDWTYNVNCSTKVVTFNAWVSDTSTPYYQYSWNFGDNTTLGQLKKNQTHTYTSSGHFNVCLSIRRFRLDSGNVLIPCYDTTICKYILVPVNCCNLHPSFGSTLNCATKKLEVLNYSTGDTAYVNWFWSWGDGSSSTGKNPGYHYYNSPGTYNVCLKATKSSDTSCHESFCKTIVIPQVCCPVANFYTYNSCNTFNFLNTTQGGTSFWWSFGDSSYSSQKNPYHTYYHRGTYNACLTVFDSVKHCSTTVCKTINVNCGWFGGGNHSEASPNNGGDVAKLSPVTNGDIKVYPNPVDNNLAVELPNTSNIKIININGQTLSEYNQVSGTFKIDVSNLSPGFYFINVQNGEVSKNIKFVKN